MGEVVILGEEEKAVVRPQLQELRELKAESKNHSCRCNNQTLVDRQTVRKYSTDE